MIKNAVLAVGIFIVWILDFRKVIMFCDGERHMFHFRHAYQFLFFAILQRHLEQRVFTGFPDAGFYFPPKTFVWDCSVRRGFVACFVDVRVLC